MNRNRPNAGTRAPAPQDRQRTALTTASTHSLLLVALAVLPTPALAEVCDKVRPLWDPANGLATVVDEAKHLALSPLALILIAATAIVVRLRSQWGGLAVVCGWSFFTYFVALPNTSDPVQQLALQEGCIGSPTLFIAVVAAICTATILYTAPIQGRSND